MYCRYCGKEMVQGAVVCVQCGAPSGAGTAYCPFCGNPTAPGAVVCVKCGRQLSMAAVPPGTQQKSKITAGLLALLVGFGIHNFYLGYVGKGVAQLVLLLLGWILSLIGIGFIFVGAVAIWQLVEAIMIFSGSINKDAKGIPLKD